MKAHSYDVIWTRNRSLIQTQSPAQKIQQEQSKYGFTDPPYFSGRENLSSMD